MVTLPKMVAYSSAVNGKDATFSVLSPRDFSMFINSKPQEVLNGPCRTKDRF